MNRILRIVLISLLIFLTANSQVRIKDITRIENVHQEMLVGYGLVVGLNGTGDRASTTRGAVFTVQSISNMLERFGITVPKEQLRTRNVAAVMLTAKTPAYGKVGSQFDVSVSSLGDATSLEGGVLLMTPLRSADGTVYAMAQGAVSVGGFNIETTAGEQTRKNHALVGIVPNGATLQRDMPLPKFESLKALRFVLNEPDFSTAVRIVEKINAQNDSTAKYTFAAKALNASIIELTIPPTFKDQGDIIPFIATIETLQVVPGVEARVVINERTGTVVAGGDVRISEVMISHGNLTIHIRRRPVISQPTAPFSTAGTTVVEYITETTIRESDAKVAVIPNTTTVSDLARALNELALRPRDIIAIFQALKQAGALNARLIIM